MDEVFHFNALKEPWIPVERTDGTISRVGIWDALAQAHQIRGICAPNPLFNCGIERLLIAFVLDALRPQRARDIAAIIKQGQFEVTRLREYVSICHSEAVSFDLFDRERPFLQSTFPDEGHSKEWVSKLFLEIPAGNNHVHYFHAHESSHAFTPADCLMALTTLAPFAMMLAQSTSYSVNGVPPIYVLYAGRTLFETIALSMVAIAAIQAPFDDPPVCWRMKEPVSEGLPAPGVSLLSALTAQPRRVKLFPEWKDGTMVVRQMYYAKGYDYKQITEYQDPHAVYYKNAKDESRTLTAREDRALWRDTGILISRASVLLIRSEMDVKRRYLKDAPSIMPFKAYSLLTKQKGATRAAMSWSQETLSLAPFLFEDEDKAVLFRECLDFMESCSGCLASVFRSTLKRLRGSKEKKGVQGAYATFSTQAQMLCLAQCHDYITGEFLSILEHSNPEADGWGPAMRSEFWETMPKITLSVLGEYANRTQPSGKSLEWWAAAEVSLRAMLNRLKKGGQPDEA